jgi:hypothetical protein
MKLSLAAFSRWISMFFLRTVSVEQFGGVGFKDVADLSSAKDVSPAFQAASDYIRDHGGVGTIRLKARGYFWASDSMVDLWPGVNVKGEHCAVSVNMTDAGGENTPASPIPVTGTVLYGPGPVFDFFRCHGGNKLQDFCVDKTVDAGDRVGDDPSDRFTGGRIFEIINASGVVVEDVTVHRAYDVTYLATVSPMIPNGVLNSVRIRNLNVCRYEHIGTTIIGACDASFENGSWYARDNMMSVHPYAIWVENFAATIDFIRVNWLGGKGLRFEGGTAYYNRIFDIHVMHCCIDSMLGDAPTPGQGIWIGPYCNDIWFEGCWVGTNNVGWRLSGYCSNIEIVGCTGLNHQYSPIIVEGDRPAGLKVQGCTFWANNLAGSAGYGAGVTIGAGAKKFLIQNNIIDNVADYTGLGPGFATAAIVVAVGASDYYRIEGNLTNGLAITDGGTGVHKVVQAAL